MFKRLLRIAVIPLLLALLIIGGVIIYWQETQRAVSAVDVGLYLVALPVAVIASWFAIGALVRWLGERREAQAAQASSAMPEVAQVAAGKGAEWAVLAVGVATRAGDDASAVVAELRQGQCRPEPDAELCDGEGFPVRAARAELDVLAVDEWLERRGTAASSPDGVKRALTLLAQALAPNLDWLTGHADALAVDQLEICVAVPVRWPEDWREVSRAWVHELMAAQPWQRERLRVHVLSAQSGQELLQVLVAHAQAPDPVGKSTRLLLAACESSIDETFIAELESSGRLFTAANQQGVIPSEAAAALLLELHQPETPLHEEALAVFAPGAMRQREQSADQGKVNARTLTELVAAQLVTQATPAQQIGTVLSDMDHRSTRITEQALLITELFEHLDAVKDALAAGQALGTLGAVAGLLPLAMACAECSEAQAPVLALSLSDPFLRTATLVRPPLAAKALAT